MHFLDEGECSLHSDAHRRHAPTDNTCARVTVVQCIIESEFLLESRMIKVMFAVCVFNVKRKHRRGGDHSVYARVCKLESSNAMLQERRGVRIGWCTNAPLIVQPPLLSGDNTCRAPSSRCVDSEDGWHNQLVGVCSALGATRLAARFRLTRSDKLGQSREVRVALRCG